MQKSAQILKDELLRALDDENNVLDMSAVLGVVSNLENIQITREILELTRLGKYVNEMRRKTTSKDLAKRAKNLVRKWKQIIDQESATHPSSSINGSSVAAVGNGGPGPPPYNLSSVSLQSAGSKPPSPANSTASSKGSSRPVTPVLPSSRRISPKVPPSRSLVAASHKSLSPALPYLDTPKGRDITSVGTKRKSRSIHQDEPIVKKMDCESDVLKRGNGNFNKEVSPKLNGLLASSNCDISQHKGLNSKVMSQPIMNSINRSPDLKLTIAKKMNSSILDTPDVSKDKFVSFTPKVKTTAELIAGLSASGGLAISKSNETVTKIANNQIEKEHDNVQKSIVPPEAKPRPRKKPGSHIAPPNYSMDCTMSQTKTELVHKFLQTSVTPSSSEVDLASSFKSEDANSSTESPIKDFLDGSKEEDSKKRNNNNLTNSDIFENEAQPVMFFIGDEDIKHETELQKSDIESHGSQDMADNRMSAVAQDPWSHIPEVDCEGLNWDTDQYPPVVHPDVSDTMVERLSSEQWEGVNGHVDLTGTWRDWTQTSTFASYNGDHLHIMPYVIIEDVIINDE